jgi:integrase/recombinase XerD
VDQIMAVHKNEKGQYVLDFRVGGRRGKRKRVTLSAKITDEAVAKAMEEDFIGLAREKAEEIPSRATVAELIDAYLAYVQIHRKQNTVEDVTRAFAERRHDGTPGPLRKYLGGYVISGLSDNHMDMYKRSRRAEGKGNRTINKELSYFSGFLAWCRRPPRSLRVQIRTVESLHHERPIPQVLSLEETIAIVDALEPVYRGLIVAMFSLGIRRAEATLLQWEDVNLEHKTVTIRDTKSGEARLLYMSEWLIECIEEIRPEKLEGFVFPSIVTHGQIKAPRSPINRACKRIGFTKRCTPHLLRHSLGTWLMDADVNMRKIQKQLGHKNIASTLWYTHVQTRASREISELIDRKVSEARRAAGGVDTLWTPPQNQNL